MRVITPLGCISCREPLKGLREPLKGLGEVGSGAAIIGVLAFAAIVLTIAGRGKKKR